MEFPEILLLKYGARLADIANKSACEFLNNSGLLPWGVSAINTGTLGAISGTPKHPGVMPILSSATPNSGYRIRLNPDSLLLGGGEKTTIIFKPATTLLGVTARFGFHDSSDVTAPVDGVYAEIVDGVLSGKTSNNNTKSTTGTTFTLTADTWYRLVILLNNDATSAKFTLYADDSNTVLWSDSLAENIPNTAGREVCHAYVCTYSGSSAITIGSLDYMDVVLPKARRVV